PDGTRGYVPVFSDDAVQVIDLATNTVIGLPIPVGDGPDSIAITPDGSRAYVANFLGDSVSVINTTSNTVIGLPIPVGDGPTAIAI
ncbi:YncE family protein, partial [Bacillus thuringiensis]|nr:YncE family protein [Bacillus thuringiensis]